MNVLISLVVASVVVAAINATGSGGGSGSPDGGYGSSDSAVGYGTNRHSGSYPPASSKTPRGGYGSNQGHGSPSYPSYGRRRTFFPKPPPPQSSNVLDDLDKVYSRLEDVLTQLKWAEEQLGSLQARLALQKKFLDELELTITELTEIDNKQNNRLTKLEEHLSDLTDQINNELEANLAFISNLNYQNNALQLSVENKWARERARNVRQEKEIAILRSAVKSFKDALLQAKNNLFEIFYSRVKDDAQKLQSLKAQESRRICEVGRVSLTAADWKAAYTYQTTFTQVPQVLWGLCGFNFDLNHRVAPAHYGYGYPPEEPNSIGVRTIAYSSKTTVVIESLDLSFGDTFANSVDVCFQACSIGPGSGPVDH